MVFSRVSFAESEKCVELGEFGFSDFNLSKSASSGFVPTQDSVYTLLDTMETSKPKEESLKDLDLDLFEKLEACGRPISLNDGKFMYNAGASCNSRFCKRCAQKRSSKYQMFISKYFETFKKYELSKFLRFVTLTYDNVPILDDISFGEISKDLNRFTRFLKSLGYLIFGGYRTLEIVFHARGDEKFDRKSGRSLGFYVSDNFNVHVHLLYFADVSQKESCVHKFNSFVEGVGLKNQNGFLMRYEEAFFPPHLRDKRKDGFGFIDFKFLNEAWAYSNHRGSRVTKPVLIKFGVSGGISYICKYISKEFGGVESPRVLVAMNNFISGKRLFQKFGLAFKDFKISAFHMFSFGFSGGRLRFGELLDCEEVFDFDVVKKDLNFFVYYMPYFESWMSMEENLILNAAVKLA